MVSYKDMDQKSKILPQQEFLFNVGPYGKKIKDFIRNYNHDRTQTIHTWPSGIVPNKVVIFYEDPIFKMASPAGLGFLILDPMGK